MEQVKSIGGRKSAKARITLTEGKGKIFINGRPLAHYFSTDVLQKKVLKPLATLELANKYDAKVLVAGGGVTGQAEAIAHGIARSLLAVNEKNRLPLKQAGLLTRDPRMPESKKYGQKGARAKFQWVKR